jgi:phosphoribosylformylglycinamidine cyclo-ligase
MTALLWGRAFSSSGSDYLWQAGKTCCYRVVSAIAAACQAQGCVLTGGETTEQPDIVPEKTYILGSSIVGVVERDKIIDGSKIKPGDVVLALGSSGPHTNGYTLIRDLLEKNPALASESVGKTTFIDAVLEPHKCYYNSVKGLFDNHLMAWLILQAAE